MKHLKKIDKHLLRAEKYVTDGDKRGFTLKSHNELSRLVHELETHKIELELQNEDLILAQNELIVSRDEYAELYNSAPAGYLTMDSKGVIKNVNTSFLAMLGRSQIELIDRPLSNFIFEEDQDIFYHLLRSTKETSGIQQNELRLKTKLGDLQWVNIESIREQTICNKDFQIRSIISNIGRRKKSEVEQERLQRELNQAQKMQALGQLTGGITHNFNNILNVIIGYTELALDRSTSLDDEKLSSELEVILSTSLRASALIDRMSQFSYKRVHDCKPLQLKPMLEPLFEVIRPFLPTSIAVNIEADENVPSILSDQVFLEQLLMNLSINACDAMEDNGRLTIQLKYVRNLLLECANCHQEVVGDWVSLSITDTGSGISTDNLEHIFEPFFTTKDVSQGTGFGLSSVNDSMHNHEGHIIVKSKIGVGTTFQMLFPIVIEEESIKNSDKEQTSEALMTPLQGQGKHVLIVDDEKQLGLYLSRMLELNGYKISLHTDSTKALDTFNKDPESFDLILTDQAMPNITGLQLVRAVQEKAPNMPIILQTGFSETATAEVAEDMKIGFLIKPVTSIKLLQLINERLKLASDRL